MRSGREHIIPMLCILLFIMYQQAFCQNASITVLSAADKQSLPKAHVTISVPDSKKTQTILADTNGKTEIPLGPGQQKVRIFITYLGFQKLIDTVYAGESKIYYLHPEPVTLNQVVITAQYAPNNPEKAVHKVNIIDRKKIGALGAVTLRDVISNETNIRLSQDNVLGSSISIQG